MRELFFIALIAATALNGAVVLDRIAVVAGKRVIKSSDIERDLRVTEFLNNEPLNTGAAMKRKAADRLIDQAIIRQEIDTGGFSLASDAEADGLLRQIRHDRYRDSEPALLQALTPYGLDRTQLFAQLLWQMTVLRFIDERFRPGILVTDAEIRAYYDQHLPDLKKQYPKQNTLEDLTPEIRNSLEGERINAEFETWLTEARKNLPVEYREGAFQ